MHHLTLLSRAPQAAQDIAPEVKLTFIRNVLDAGITNELIAGSLLRDLVDVTIPLFRNKDPQNPLPPG